MSWREWLSESQMFLRDLRREPVAAAERLEQVHPSLARYFLSLASEFSERGLWGRKLKVVEWNSERMALQVRVRDLPIIVAVAELGFKTLLARSLPALAHRLSLKGIAVEVDRDLPNTVEVRCELKGQEREPWLLEAQAQGQAERTVAAWIYSEKGIRIGEMGLRFQLRSTLELGSRC